MWEHAQTLSAWKPAPCVRCELRRAWKGDRLHQQRSNKGVGSREMLRAGVAGEVLHEGNVAQRVT